MLKQFCIITLVGLVSIPALGGEPTLRGNSRQESVSSTDSRVAAGKIRASKLIGTKLVNRSNENVGTIGDLVIDSDSGQVEYAAVSFGGFLGMGDKWFAVPMEAIKVETLPNSGQSVLVLNVTKQQMEGAVGFDDAGWPNFADPQFTNDLYRRFEVKRRGPFSVDRGGVDVNIGNGGVSVDLERQRP